ncbi:MAG TPA: PKD domain-containing protein, partial [Methanospirillum sp.]|uniref:PKD domain-containing protein n=1 Tax=Methanospirillum sp. TaxID=45200 RepID=UPI002BBCC252
MNSKDRAVSEVVAAILLISLVIIGISIVSVMLTSGPPPEDIPKVSVQMIPKDEDTSGANASFYHGGGDSLRFYATTFTDEKGNPIDLNNVYLVKWNVTSGEKDYEVRWKDHPDLEWNYSSVVNITEINDGYQIHHNISTGNYLIKEFGTGHSRPIEIPNVTAVPTIVPIPGFCNDTPSAAFTADMDGIYGNNLTCIASAQTDNLTHKWTISGKNFLPVSKTNEKSFTYTLPIPFDTNSQGYFIQHTVYNSTPLCSDSSIQYVTVPPCSDAPCVAGFSYLVDGKTVQFTADGPDKGFFSWEYGDGQNKTIINNTKVEHTYLDNKSIHSVTLTKKINRCDQDFTCSVTQKVTTESIVCGCFIDNYDPSTRNPWNVEFTWNPLTACTGLSGKDWKVKFDFGDGSNSETYSKDGFAEVTQWPGTISHSYSECRDYSVKMDVIDLHGGIYYTCTRTVQLPCICTTNPEPAFTATAITPSNLTTIITDTSTPSDIIQWTYDFGDGTTPINFNTTTKPDPFIFTHTYSSCGSYVIKLIVHDAMGCWAETTRTISCGGDNCEPDDIRAEFSATADPNNPKLFKFIDSSYSNNNTLTRWEWDFGDGTSAINTSPPGTFWIEYDKCSSFPVKLRVWDDIGCWDDLIKEVSCNCPKPVAQFTVESMSNPREFRFTSTSTHDPSVTITDWEWDFGDGVTSTGSSVTHRYTSPGTYTVRLRVTTNCGSWDHTFQDITTGCPSPKAAFEYNNTTNPQQFVFTDRSTHEPFVNISWLWEFGDGTNSTEQNPTHTFPSCSQYTVRLKVTADCGSSNETIQNVMCGCPSPKAAFEYDTTNNPQEFVFRDRSTHDPHVNLSWLWEFGDGTNSTEQNPTHT